MKFQKNSEKGSKIKEKEVKTLQANSTSVEKITDIILF